MKIFISASSSRNEFINSIQSLIETEYQDKHECIYIPWHPSLPRDPTLLDRIKSNIIVSHLILMDVTPEELRTVDSSQTKWVTNEGVLIEYGIIVAFDWLYKLCVYCDAQVDRDHIHPAFHKPIDPYTVDDIEAFKQTLKIVIRNREQSIEEEAIRREIDLIPTKTSLAGSISPYSERKT